MMLHLISKAHQSLIENLWLKKQAISGAEQFNPQANFQKDFLATKEE